MTRAEKQALEVYPVMSLTNDTNAPKRKYFTDGYALAQQDFIEKAMNYLKRNLLRYIDLCERGVGISTEEFIDDFKEYMKGE